MLGVLFTMRVRWWAPMLATLLFAAALLPAQAGPYSSVTVFGDSLSDTGNVFAFTGEPSAPYVGGRFSNGPVAVERLAANLGLPLTSYAFGGATTGIENAELPEMIFGPLHFTGLLSQVGSFVSSLGMGPADADSLYVVWAGGNDFLALITDPGLDPLVVAGTAVANLASAVVSLYDAGARHFLLPNLPNIGLTPDPLLTPAGAAALTALSAGFNAELAAAYDLLAGALPGIDVTQFDVFGLQNAVVADPAAFGLTNTTGTCYDGFVGVPSGNAPCANPDEYLFWDIHHPTARTHQILGDAMTAALPLPATWPLVVLALLAGAGLGRSRRFVAARAA